MRAQRSALTFLVYLMLGYKQFSRWFHHFYVILYSCACFIRFLINYKKCLCF
jgi:hypothetical protein